jgi:hypothetical protein
MDQDYSTRHVLQGRELIDYLVEKASSTTNAELLRREDRRNRRTTFVFSLISLVGIGAVVGAIKMFVQQEIIVAQTHVADDMRVELEEALEARLQKFEQSAQASVAKQVDDQVGQVRSLLEQYKQYQELLAICEIIKVEVENDKFPEQQMETALKLIEQLATADSITGQPRFLEAAKVVIDLLVRTDRKSDIDDVEQLLHTVLVSDSKIALDLADHYGQLIISSPYPVESMQHEFEVLSRYATAARALKYPEKALLWELFVAYKRSKYTRSATTDSMVEMIQDLNEADARNFCYHIFLNSHPLHWMNTPDQEGRELARLVARLLEDYPDLRKTIEAQMTTPELRPLIDNLIARKAERLERLGLQSQPTEEAPAETATTPGDANDLRR